MSHYTPARHSAGSSLGFLSRIPAVFPAFFLVALLALCRVSGATAAPSIPNTLFIPPAINSPSDAEQLGAKVDLLLAEALKARGLTMLPRDEVRQKIGYAAWPPRPEALRSLPGASSANFLVTGTLTHLGGPISLDFVIYDLLSQTPPRYHVASSAGEAGLKDALVGLVGAVLRDTGRDFLIRSLAIKGNNRIDAGAILRRVKSKAGEPYDPELLRNDLKSIFQMGYFEDVRVEANDTPAGRELTFLVTEKAVVSSVRIDGEKEIKEDEIKDVITVTPNSIINTKAVQASVDAIRKLYKDKGFYKTTVSAKLDQVGSDKVNLSFVIDEGVKVFIRGIRFVGNKAFTEKEIKKEMSTSEKGLLSWFTDSGKLKRDLLEQDRARIGALYHNNGYLEAKISEAALTYEDDRLYITFDIDEGRRFMVGTIELEGDIVGDKNELFGLLNLAKEKFFSRKVLRDDVMRLTDRYAEQGYAFAEISPDIRKNAEDQRMDVVIRIAKGDLIHVNRVVIKGNSRTRDRVIRREIQLKEGGILDASAVRRSSERLQRLEYFEEVNVTPEPTPKKDEMDVVVSVKEKPTGTFSVGAGYSSVDSFMFMGEISENNFLGQGQRLSLQANLSSTSNRFNLSFTEPRLNDTPLLFGVDLYNWTREYNDYTKNSSGGALRFAYPVWNKWHLGWGYGYDDTELTDVLDTASDIIKDSTHIKTTSFVRLGISKDTRNRPSDPTRGFLTAVNLKHAGGFLGGDSAFTRMEASSSWHHPLFWDTSVRIKGAFGYVIENEEGMLPVFEKFYLGGLNTIRGFEHGDISPLAPNSAGGFDRIGGEKMWYSNIEWIFPLVKDAGLKGLVFFDVGNVYTDSETWDISDLRSSVGLGFRWMSPMGPLRLEWGYNLSPREGEKQGVWDFSMGGAF